MRRRGTRVGAISIYCANEALADSGINLDEVDRDRVGIYLGITEHGNVETEEEVFFCTKIISIPPYGPITITHEQ